MQNRLFKKTICCPIQVYSASLERDIDQLYNLQTQGGGNVQTGGSLYGYLVDQRGNIELPRIGIIHAEGVTKSQLADEVKSRLREQLTNPSVIVRFLNFRVVVIGEVGTPGVKTVNVENLNILEALALSGDITLFGKKKEVKVLRENNGKRQLGIIDVTSKNMFQSPYYQLQQNDIVMVEQSKYKIRSTEQQRVSQQLGFALSIITSIALLYNIFK